MITQLRGRDRETAVLGGALEGVVGGGSASALIEGAPGTGKTRLLEETAALCRAAGCTVITVRADELDQYAPLATLLAAVDALDGGDRSDEPAPRAATDGTGAADQRIGLLDHLADRLEHHSRRVPLAVLVDDVQWADPATLFALRALPTRLAGLPILWVLTVRPGSGRTVVDRAREHLLGQPGAHHLILSPLPPEEVVGLAADVLGAAPEPALARRLRETGGNPFLVTEVLRAVAEGDPDPSAGAAPAAPGTEDVPVALRRSLRVRMGRLPADTARLLQVGAVLGREFDLATAARLLDRPVAALLASVDTALEADVLATAGDRLTFRHDLLRHAVYEELPLPVRSALHGQAAELLSAAGRRPAEVARHLVLAAGPLDVGALDVLRDALRELAPTAPETAADLALQAARLLPADDPRQVELVTEAAQLLGWTRRIREALELVDATLCRRPPAAQEAALRLVAAEIHQSAGEDDEAMGHLLRALDLPDLPGELRFRLLKTRGNGHLRSGGIDAAEQIGRELVPAAHDSTDPADPVSALLFESQVAFYRGRPARALELAEQAAHRAAAAPEGLRLRPPRAPELWMATVLAGTDRLPEAERLLGRGLREAEASGTGWALPQWHAARACVLLERGRLGDAAAEAEASLTVAEELELLGAGAAVARSVLALTALAVGDPAGAERHLAAVAADGAGAWTDAPWTALARACLLDAAGEAEAAAAALHDPCGSDGPAPLLAVTPGHWPRVLRIALRAGDRDLAEAVAGAVGRIAADSDQRVVRAVHAHIGGVLAGDPDRLASAVALLRHPATRPPALAAACEDLAEVLAAAGRGSAAVAHLEEAARLTAACGASRDRERIEDRLRSLRAQPAKAAHRVPAAVSGWDSLTQSELRVVHLVAAGLTNRAVADELYLSVHTVNTHLRHVFTKLGIGSRVELARQVVQRDVHERDRGVLNRTDG